MTPIDHSRPSRWHLDDFALGRLFLELDLAAGQIDEFLVAARQSIGRNNLQSDDGVGGAANQVDHVVQSPADDIDHRRRQCPGQHR